MVTKLRVISTLSSPLGLWMKKKHLGIHGTGGGGVRLVVPTWLANEYKMLQEKLQDKISKSKTGMPLCYERGTFYDGTLSAFFNIFHVH